jgi:mono/diheme cytochrome c family protein
MKLAHLLPLSALLLGACGKSTGGLGPGTDAAAASLPGPPEEVPAEESPPNEEATEHDPAEPENQAAKDPADPSALGSPDTKDERDTGEERDANAGPEAGRVAERDASAPAAVTDASAPRDAAEQPVLDAAPPVVYRKTYHRDVRPLLEAHCGACHVASGIAPFALSTYAQVSPLGAAILASVESGSMPPYPAAAGCREERDARRLPATDLDTLRIWRDEGFPEGTASDYLTRGLPQSQNLGTPTRTLRLATPYTPDLTIPDDYRCFLLPGEFAADTYLTAIGIEPGVRGEVHHVVVYQIPASGLTQLSRYDAVDTTPGYPCFGGVNVTGAQNLYSYRPGATAMTFESGDAIFVERGARIVVQMHYNTQSIPAGGSALPDQTQVNMWNLPDGNLPTRVVARAQAISNFRIPAGQKDLSVSAATSLSTLSAYGRRGLFGAPTYVQGEIIGMTPHMHNLGTKISATLRRTNGATECLVNVPAWAFEWQLDYLFAAPLNYASGDQVQLSCTFDNSAEHQPVVLGQRVEPREVTWGEGSMDEMCLTHVWFRYPREAFLAAIR